MEVILQWLDDAEDLIFALPLAWERVRVTCLKVGLVSALILGASQVFRVLLDWAPTFASAAVACVLVWTTGVVAGAIADLRVAHARSHSP